MAEPLIFVFAILACTGLLVIALSKPEEKKEQELHSIWELATTRNLGIYLFLVMFLLTSLQINVDYASVSPDISTGAVLVDISVLLLVVALLTHIMSIITYVGRELNKRR